MKTVTIVPTKMYLKGKAKFKIVLPRVKNNLIKDLQKQEIGTVKKQDTLGNQINRVIWLLV